MAMVMTMADINDGDGRNNGRLRQQKWPRRWLTSTTDKPQHWPMLMMDGLQQWLTSMIEMAATM
jgi:hypothetical protein